MELPAALLDGHFESSLVRGAIIRFQFDKFVDPKKPAVAPKFALVLNNPNVLDPIYLALTTSQTAVYDKLRNFDPVLMRFDAGEYCFTLPTVVAFRSDPVEMRRTSLRAQFSAGKLSFHGALSAAHLARLNQIIKDCPYIKPLLREFLLPDSPIGGASA